MATTKTLLSNLNSLLCNDIISEADYVCSTLVQLELVDPEARNMRPRLKSAVGSTPGAGGSLDLS